jgi:glycine cleavage system H protein
MAVIEQFLGRCVEIPEDRRYDTRQGLWAKADGEEIIFGLSEPALVLGGGLNDLDWLVPDGRAVKAEEAVAFAITGKILYINAPFKGRVRFNPGVKQSPSLVSEEPYGRGWLFRIRPEAGPERVLQTLAGHEEYVEGLRGTEGFKNPEGLKGGVSGICKAVYSSIRGQKIELPRK